MFNEIARSLDARSEDESNESTNRGLLEDKQVVEPLSELIGIDPSVYRQINAALKAGSRHIMFYGPPGTGKTTIAQRVAGEISEQWKLITGSSDFTSQDVLGGYIPLADGKLKFFPGVLLENFDRPLIFDELNRCDIDKVIGPLFSVLSGQSTVLPYLSDPNDPESSRVEIRPKGTSNPPASYSPSSKWMIIATINSIDKASLYQMSYALTRRFAWIYVAEPSDADAFLREYLSRDLASEIPATSRSPLAEVWSAINDVRPIGAAPIIDVIRYVLGEVDGFDFFAPTDEEGLSMPLLDALSVYVFPMLDGILRDESDSLRDKIADALKLSQDARMLLSSRLIQLSI
ncbi:AAA family ATPase [Stieleria bergensis]